MRDITEMTAVNIIGYGALQLRIKIENLSDVNYQSNTVKCLSSVS